MSRALFSLSPDLKRLRDEGYFVQKRGGFLILRDVPYVDSTRTVRRGTLISTLALAGERTTTPDTHVMQFDGEYPCNPDGSPIAAIRHASADTNLGHGLKSRHSFSSKPDGGYPDYYAKMSTYAAILSGPATILQPGVTACSLRDYCDDDDSVFQYTETASDRVGIGALTARLTTDRIAIIGLGGSGSYILDFVAKTPVPEIRIIDGDEFLQHNAFRAPGAAALEVLREAPMKVDYFKGIYSRMHRGIVAHGVHLKPTNLDLLDGVTFAFLSLDAGEDKRAIVERLEAIGIPFIDIGMGLELNDGHLSGILRITTSTPESRALARGRIPLAGGGKDDLYASNIQVADLNALNALFAVIKWKKLRAFYADGEREHHSTYTTDANMLLNGDFA
ncbi:MAG: ThiF family adenylyltransferase [Chloroflexi bacterium]|nr:ThiF family adenylyltransferase [Chloroflexota bacterium]